MKTLLYQHLLITLFGPRNETLVGELNMTGITMPRTDPDGMAASEGGTGSGGGVDVTASKGVYDSRGAAYYICIVILVYAMAIVSFVVSLARRRNSRDKYRLAHDGRVIDYVTNATKTSHVGGGGESCWKQRKGDLVSPLSPSPWSSTSSSYSDPSNRLQVATKVDPLRNSDEEGARPSFEERMIGNAMSCSHGNAMSCSHGNLKDEIITLVQVLPISGDASVAAEKEEEEEEIEGGREVGLYGDEPPLSMSMSGQSSSGGEGEDCGRQRCRWSMGPDGNIWILQVGDTTDAEEGEKEEEEEKNARRSAQNLLSGQSLPNPSSSDHASLSHHRRNSLLPLQQPAPSVPATSSDRSHQRSRADQRRSKNLAFSPVPKGYRQRGRSTSRERKVRLAAGETTADETTAHPHQRNSYDDTKDYATAGREGRWEEYHFLDPEPLCVQTLGSPHYIQKLIHVTSV